MKINKSLILFALLALTCFTSVFSKLELGRKTKTESKNKIKKSETETQQEGSGDWENGYNCPGLVIAKVEKGAITKLVFSEKQEVFFQPGQILGAFGRNGLKFTLKQEPKGELKNVLVKDKDLDYYLPYRFIQTEFQFIREGTLMFKVLQGYLTTDTNQLFFLKLYLPRKLVGNYISTEQCETLIIWINIRKNEYQKQIIDNKEKIISAANEIIDNKNLLSQLSTQTSLEEESFKKKIEADKQEVQKKMDGVQEKIAQNNKLIEELQIQINEHKNTNTKLLNEYDNNVRKLYGLSQTLLKFKNYLLDKEKTKNEMQTKIKEKTEEVHVQIGFLVNKSVNDNEHIKGLAKKIDDAKSSDEILEELNHMYPVLIKKIEEKGLDM
jgi:hypothetical protein